MTYVACSVALSLSPFLSLRLQIAYPHQVLQSKAQRVFPAKENCRQLEIATTAVDNCQQKLYCVRSQYERTITYLVSLSVPLFVLGTQNHLRPQHFCRANNSQRKKLWAKREQYGNDREKESSTAFSSIVPHKVSCLSIRRQHHAIASSIDQASTKKVSPHPPLPGRFFEKKSSLNYREFKNMIIGGN